jgi:nitrite reductase (NADH) small subunit
MVASVSREFWVDVCPVDALIDNGGVCALVNARQIAIFRLAPSQLLFALDNFDPFSAAAVLSRGVVGDLQGQPVVASPIYKHHFNLQTGQCLEDPCVKVTTYPVRITEEVLQVMVDASEILKE